MTDVRQRNLEICVICVCCWYTSCQQFM